MVGTPSQSVDKALFFVFFLAVLTVFAYSIYTYWYQKDFTILVEASCDPASSSCYIRDCSIEDECPPNNFSEYRVFSVSAKDFAKCEDETCLYECTNNVISCLEITCGSDEEDECTE